MNPVFYFSGTGTSLFAAKRICAELPGFEPVPIAALRNEKNVAADADAVGFVFPMYYSGLPRIVADFVRRLSFARPCYAFAVVPCGRARGYALRQLDGLLKKRGTRLSAGYYLETASNYLPYNDLSKEEITRLQAECENSLGEVVEKLRSRKRYIAPENRFIHALYPFMMRQSRGYYKHFRVEGGCSACGICQRVCPTGNIELKGGRPLWGSGCQYCLACIHYCPQRAIQWKDVTQEKERYHYKGISAGEIAKQKAK